MPSVVTELETLDINLRRNYPNVHAELREGVAVNSWRSQELNEWFRWRNGQAPDSTVRLLWLFRFVGITEGRQSLAYLRRDLLAHPLNGLIILFLSSRLLYSIPILVDEGGNGFYYDEMRNTIFYREHAERDRVFGNWKEFLDFLTALLGSVPARQSQMFQQMEDLLSEHTTPKR